MTNARNQSKTREGNNFLQRLGEAFMYTSQVGDFGLSPSPAEILLLSKITDEPSDDDNNLESKTKHIKGAVKAVTLGAVLSLISGCTPGDRVYDSPRITANVTASQLWEIYNEECSSAGVPQTIDAWDAFQYAVKKDNVDNMIYHDNGTFEFRNNMGIILPDVNRDGRAGLDD